MQLIRSGSRSHLNLRRAASFDVDGCNHDADLVNHVGINKVAVSSRESAGVHGHAVHGDADIATARGRDARKSRIRMAIAADAGYDSRGEVEHIAADDRQIHDLVLGQRISNGR